MSKIVRIEDRRPKDCVGQLKEFVDECADLGLKVKAAVLVIHKESGPLTFHMTGDYITLEMLGVLRLLMRDLEERFDWE